MSTFKHHNATSCDSKAKAVDEANEAAAAKLLACEDRWLNRALSAEDCKQFCKKMGFKRTKTQIAGWPTVKDKLLPKYGYIVTSLAKGHEKATYMIER